MINYRIDVTVVSGGADRAVDPPNSSSESTAARRDIPLNRTFQVVVFMHSQTTKLTDYINNKRGLGGVNKAYLSLQNTNKIRMSMVCAIDAKTNE